MDIFEQWAKLDETSVDECKTKMIMFYFEECGKEVATSLAKLYLRLNDINEKHTTRRY